MPGVVWGPSDKAVDLGRLSKQFARPVAMTPDQIQATNGTPLDPGGGLRPKWSACAPRSA